MLCKKEFPAWLKFLNQFHQRRQLNFLLYKQAPEINSTQTNDPLNCFETVKLNKRVIDIQIEQKKDSALQKLMAGIQKGCTDVNTYASLELKKYYKQISLLQAQKRLLTRPSFMMLEKFCIIKCAFDQDISDKKYSIKCTTHRQLFTWEISEPLESFVRDATFRGSNNCFQITWKTVGHVWHWNEVTKSKWSLPCSQSHPNSFFREVWCTLTCIVQLLIYKYAVSGIDVFPKYLFAVQLTSPHASSIARTLVSIVF